MRMRILYHHFSHACKYCLVFFAQILPFPGKGAPFRQISIFLGNRVFPSFALCGRLILKTPFLRCMYFEVIMDGVPYVPWDSRNRGI